MQTNPYRVLVIDDHPAILQVVGRYLAQTGVAELAGTCSDPSHAVEHCRELKPDLVLCDAHMPIISGLDLARILTRDAPEVPVLMFSARDDNELRQQSIQAGATGLISKTASPEELRIAIEHAIAQHHTPQP